MKKNVVVVGYGGMGGWHTESLQESDVCNLLGIYDIKEERREAARKEGIFAYDSLEAVLEDPRVDLITIAVPNDAHKEIAIRAMEAGKNVISEKPVTLSCADLQEMIDASDKTGKIFSVHQNRRWDEEYLGLKKVYDSGEIGEIVRVESRVQGSHGIPGDWRGTKEHGGGMVFDWGIHLLDQLLMMMHGKVVRVHCLLDNITNQEVDDGFRITLTFDNGATAYAEVGTNNFISLPRFYMLGIDGTAIVDDWNKDTRVVRCKLRKDANVVPVKTAAGLTKTMAPRDAYTIDEYTVERPRVDVHDYYRNICAAIDGTATQLVTHEQMMRDLRIIEACFESARLGQTVDVNL